MAPNRLLFIFLLFALSAQKIAAQNSFFIEGNLIDGETDEPIPFATVSVHNGTDDQLITGAITDDQGAFKISVEQGRYTVKAQYVSYKDLKIEGVIINEQSPILRLGVIEVEPDIKALEEVVITGERQQMEFELDKRVFNVGENLSNVGRNASEILDNLPSITVDVEGNVSLRGSSNIQFLVDGKPSGLLGIDGASGLKNITGDMIERVEVITNPSARYDAAGQAGIINIVLKKKKAAGVNGAFTVNAGYPSLYGATANLNYRKEWVNFFVNYGVRYRKNPGGGKSFQEFFLEDTSYVTTIDRDQLRGGLSNNIQFGTDFILNEKNIITGSLLYRVSDEDNESNLLFRDYDSNGNLVAETLRTDMEQEDESTLEYDLTYRKTFDRKGQEFSATVQYRDNAETEQSELVNYATNDLGSPILQQRSLNNESQTNWLIQSDYVQPLGESGKFETGFRTTLRVIDNGFKVEELDEQGNWFVLPEFTNNFEYYENIYAVYAIYGNQVGKWSFQGGLRMEASDIETLLQETQEFNDKNYIDLFPSASIVYELKENRELQLSYSRRINRPGFWELNPFSSFSDNRNIRTGNPDLDPEYTDSYELGHLSSYPTGNFYLGGYYRNTQDVIQRINIVNEDGTTVRIPENLGMEDSYGLEMTASQDLLPWWTMNGNVNFFRAIVQGSAFGETLNSDTYSASMRATSIMKFDNVVEFQVSGFYRAPENRPQGRRKSLGSIDLGVTRNVLKNKGTLSLTVRDLLNSRKYRGTIEGTNFFQDSEFQWRSRQITFSFNYRLNKSNGKGSRRGNRGGYDGGGDRDDF